MIDWLSKKGREKKHLEAKEQDLKKSLAEKVSQYEKIHEEVADDHTEVFIGGKKLRVAKEQITITDTGSNPASKSK